MEKRLSERVKEMIVCEFARQLDKHLFSETVAPLSVTITTKYKECTQTNTIVLPVKGGD